jgi:hypothetical protein
MSLINYSDVTGPKIDAANRDAVNLHNGYYLREAVGYAKITQTPQTNIPVYLSSQAQAGGELVTNPDKLLVLPAGAIILRHALRLPKLSPTTANQSNPIQYGDLRPGSTLIGTTGDLVKVAPANTFTSTDPKITCVDNTYAPDASATVQRGNGVADIPTSSLVTLGAATPISVVVSNAGSTAAGTGISTSLGDAFAIVQVCWLEIQPAPNYEILGFQSKQKGF